MLYIVTPLSRLENLPQISESFKNNLILEESKNVTWIIIFDKKLEIGNFYNKLLDKKFEIDYFNKRINILKSKYSNSFVGHSHRNFFLNNLYHRYCNLWSESKKNDYVYFLDDDTVLHPDFIDEVLPIIESENNPDAIIFSQLNKNGSLRLKAHYDNIKVCHIDMGQYCLKIDSIPKDFRFKEDEYTADGIFIENFKNLPQINNVHIIEKPLSYYNFLRDE